MALLLWRRPRQAAAAASAAGCAIENAWFFRSPRTPRLLVWIAGALLLSFFGRAGLPIAFVLALISAPIAAAGTVRLLSLCRAGLLLDETLRPWSDFSGFTTDDRTGELLLLRSEAGSAPLRLLVGRRMIGPIAKALSRRLPQITAGD